jgi:hypothetical protein
VKGKKLEGEEKQGIGLRLGVDSGVASTLQGPRSDGRWQEGQRERRRVGRREKQHWGFA